MRLSETSIPLLALASAWALASCAADPASEQDRLVTRGLERTRAYVGAPGDGGAAPGGEAGRGPIAAAGRDDAVALIAGEPVTWSPLLPTLAETAGGIALERLVLDRALAARCAEAGVVVTRAMLDEERRLLGEALAPAASDDPGLRARLVDRLQSERGLGDAGLGALLRRNAMLRALVAPTVAVSDEDVRTAYRLRHEPAIGARLILARTLADARSALDRLGAGEDVGAVAADLSADSSAARGGVIPPIHPADETWPAAVRETVAGLAPGAVSDPVVVDGGLAILVREPASPDAAATAGAPAMTGAVLERARRDAALRAQRLAMQRLASEILREADVTVFDPALRFGWRVRRGGSPG